MRFVSSWIRSAVVAFIVGMVAPCGYGGIVVNIYQDGSDVKLSLSGSFSTMNSAGSGSRTPASFMNLLSQDLGYSLNELLIHNATLQQGTTVYSVYSKSPDQLWSSPTGYIYSDADSFTLVGLKYLKAGSNVFEIDDNYVFGSQISGSGTWNNKTLATLGFVNLGTYVYTAGNATNNDTVTFNIGSNPGGGGAVPEPTSMAIFGLGALGLAYRAKRKSKA